MKYLYSFSHLFLFFLVAFFITACIPQSYSPQQEMLVELQDRDIQDLQNSYKTFHKLDGIDVSLFLKKQDLNELLNNSFTQFTQVLKDNNSSQFTNVSFGKIRLAISQQSLRSNFRFSFEFNENHQKIFGHIQAQHYVKAGINQFLLETDFKDIVLEKVDDSAILEDEDANAQEIRRAVESFVHTLKIEILNTPLSIDVDMNVLSDINENNIYKAPDYATHLARPVNLKTKMKIFAPYLSSEGLLLLGSSRIKHENIKVIANVNTLPYILKEEINSVLQEDLGLSLALVQKYSSYYVSKAYLSQQMNKGFSYMDMRVINKFFMTINESDQNISKNIFFFDKNNLPSCKGLKVDCKESLKSCNKRCPMKYGIQNCSACDEINNPFEKVRCLSKVEGCRSSQEKLLYNCHKQENSCVAQNREDEKRCEIENVLKVSICEEKKDEMVFINDGIVLSKMNVNFTIPSSYAVQRLRSIHFSKNLAKLEVTRNLHLSMESKTFVSMQMNAYADLNCSFLMNETQEIHSEYDYVNQTRELLVLNQTLSDGRLKLSAVSKPSFMSTQMKNSPYDKLIKDENFALQCRYQGMPMQSISADKLLDKKEIPYALNPMLAEIELPFKEEELTFIISPVKVGKDILLYPTLEQKAIGFSRQAHFY